MNSINKRFKPKNLARQLSRYRASAIWGLSYVSIIFIFSYFYWESWQFSTDEFIIHDEFKQDLIYRNKQAFFDENFYDPSVINENNLVRQNLDELQQEFLILKNKNIDLDSELNSISKELREIEQKIELTQEQKERIFALKIDQFEKNKLAEISEREKGLVSLIKSLESKYNDYLVAGGFTDLSLSNFALEISEKRVELAGLRVEKSKIEGEIANYILNNLGEFNDAELVQQVRHLTEKQLTLSQKLIETKDELIDSKSKLFEYVQNADQERRKVLKWSDFFYYSIGISTTTTFGDIIANSSYVRSLVSIQLILSTFVIAGFTTTVLNRTRPKGNQPEEDTA